MARKKKEDNAASLLLYLFLAVIAFVVVFLTIFSSLILFGFWIYCECGAKNAGALLLKDEKDFELSRDEKGSIASMKIQMLPFGAEVERLAGEKQELGSGILRAFSEGRALGLRERKDGMFDVRMASGQQYNAEIERLRTAKARIEQSIGSCERKITALQSDINAIELQPKLRRDGYQEYLSDWAAVKGLQMAVRYSISSYCITLLALLSCTPAWVGGISFWLNKHSGIPVAFGIDALYGSMLASFVVSLAVLWAGNSFCPLVVTSKVDEMRAAPVIAAGTSVRNPANGKRLKAALMALFVGGFGIHLFYLKRYLRGTVYLLFCWTLVPSLVGLIEGMRYLAMTDQAFSARYELR